MLGLSPSTMVPSAPLSDYQMVPTERRFSPYQENHGSVVAVAGEDFAVIASETRLSGGGYNILTRDQSKLFQVSEGFRRVRGEGRGGPVSPIALCPLTGDTVVPRPVSGRPLVPGGGWVASVVSWVGPGEDPEREGSHGEIARDALSHCS